MAAPPETHFLSAAVVFNDMSKTCQVARKAATMDKPKPKAISASGKGKVGRPVTKTRPQRIDAPVKDVARAVLKTKPPKKK